MSILVRDLRLSFIWTEFDDRLLQDPLPAVPLAFLGRAATYRNRFLAIQRSYSDADGFTPPWARHRAKDFWSMYFHKEPHAVDAARAWKYFVPLRQHLAITAQPGFEGMVIADAFYYPHGYGLLVQVRLRPELITGAWSLEQAVERAHAIRSTQQFSVTTGGSASKPMTLNSLSTALLSTLAARFSGVPGDAGVRTPYTIATFVRLEGVDLTKPVEENGEVHCALEALSHWPAAWKFAPLPPLAEAGIQDPGLPSAHIHYRRRRGRVSWFPVLAAPTPERHRKLSCYHRNQSFAALQVESLSQLVVQTARRAQAGADVPMAQEQCAREAAGLLGRLYGGAKDTYHSLACQEHVRTGEAMPHLNYLRSLYMVGHELGV